MALALSAAVACDSGPTKPTPPITIIPPPTDPPKITCPASQTLQSLDGGAVVATYKAPTVTGGTAPLTTSCSPVSGTAFALGATGVTCATTDAQQRTDSCTFTITVAAPPKIALTNFLAFGDSMTEGEVSFASTLFVLEPDKAYPSVLRTDLSRRYTAQVIAVANYGKSGELITDGVPRLSSLMAGSSYQAVLILEGANDLFNGGPDAIPTIVSSLRFMERDARSRVIRPYIATLPPQRVTGIRGAGAPYVAGLNGQVRALAANEGVSLVDLETGFGSDISLLIGEDGLHPTEAGYVKMADLFFDVLRQTLEQAAPSLTGTLGLSPRMATPRPRR